LIVRRSGSAFDAHALLVEEALQLAGLEHLADDVASADELALDVELGNRRPLRIFLDALAEFVGGQDIDAFVVDAEIVEDLYDLAGKAALREARGCPS
jgi:hypothetical protein